jgi:hypothetical protein
MTDDYPHYLQQMINQEQEEYEREHCNGACEGTEGVRACAKDQHEPTLQIEVRRLGSMRGSCHGRLEQQRDHVDAANPPF